MAQADLITVRVQQITYLTETVRAFELRAATDTALPAFAAGSHIDVYLPEGLVRSYSLINPSDGRRFVIAVARDDAGRGGSKRMHAEIAVGQSLRVSAPRNNFALCEQAPHSVLIAGGIGITPLYAMLSRLEAIGRSWELHYSARSLQAAALAEELGRHFVHGAIHMHYSDADRGFLDLGALVAGAPAESHFYCCGPVGMLDAFLGATAALPAAQVHIERFGGQVTAAAGGFDVILARTGCTLRVEETQTILDRLLKEGIEMPYSCREGVCGACETRLVAGQADHRDLIQTDKEKAANKSMFICCSGSLTPSLTLDI